MRPDLVEQPAKSIAAGASAGGGLSVAEAPGSPADNVAQLVARALSEAGVGALFTYPGDPTIELMEQSRRMGTDVVLARREGTAAFMAEAAAMSTGGLGACLSTLGPGSTALVNGVAAANLDRVPVLAMSGQIETARQAVFTHQVVNHEALFAPVTKWAGRIEATAAAITMRKGIRMATAERPGAVHLTVAGDVLRQPPGDGRFTMPPTEMVAGTQVYATATAARDPAAMLAAARRPLLLAGIGAVRCDATDELERLAHTVQMPVVTAPMAKGVIDETSDWFAGVLDMACNDTVWELVRSSDLIIAAGFDPVELIKPWTVDVPVLHLDTTPNVDQVYCADIEVVGDVAASLAWLADSFVGQPRWEARKIAAFRDRLREAYYAGRVAGSLNPTDVVDIVREAAAPDAIATCDVGSHKLLVGQGWTATRPRSVLMTNGLSAMGFGVPAAIAAKLMHRDRPVVAMVGDGGFAMTATEIRLAASRGLGIVFVVFVDRSLNRIELKQSALHYPSTATVLEDTDLVAMAGAMDCDAERATTSAELESVMAQSAGLTRPLLVEARIDPSQYESQF